MVTTSPLHAVTSAATLADDAGWRLPAHFGDPAAEYDAARSAAALFDRSSRGKLTAAGTEAVVFLHNLSTNDVKGLAPGHGCETFFCTATAKAVAHGTLWREPPDGKRERLWLDLPAGQAEKLLQHLDRYLISEDVTLTDHTGALAQMHLAGPDAGRTLAAAGLDVGAWQRDTFRTVGDWTVRMTDPLGMPGYDLLGPAADAPALWQRLVAAGARPAGMEAWEMLRVEAGTPEFGKDIFDTTFAPEVGRTATAISYQKGCYLGQEPIVMARDRGMVQRGMVGLLLGADPLPPGTLLVHAGKEVGRTLSSVRSPRLGQAVALATVRRAQTTAGTELEADVAGVRRPVRVAALPLVS
ncbi:MAG: glycine cleavage T C-terminal barrel domain-containing protein [Gemmataceae bacterium]